MPASVPEPAYLIDRQPELELVAKALDGASIHGSLLLFEGASGIGKSRLLAELGQIAEELEAATLRARGGELEVGFAFAVARQLLEPRLSPDDPVERAELLAAAGAAAPLLTSASMDGNGRGNGNGSGNGHGPSTDATLNGMWRLVRRLAERRVALIAVDDLQWVDRPSLEFLLYLAQRLEDLPVVIVCSRTTGETGPNADLADRLDSVPSAQVERLAPLSADGIALLAQDEGFPDAADDFLLTLARESGGVPFLVKALLASAREAGLDGQSDPGGWWGSDRSPSGGRPRVASIGFLRALGRSPRPRRCSGRTQPAPERQRWPSSTTSPASRPPRRCDVPSCSTPPRDCASATGSCARPSTTGSHRVRG